MTFVTVPGIDGSDEDHWQTRWEAGWGRHARRITVSSWSAPDRADWVRAIGEAVAGDDVVLVAHSLGCLAAVDWVRRTAPTGRVGLVLVAPPDVGGTSFPRAAAPTFAAVDDAPVRCPGLLITSDDDPYCGAAAARRLAAGWALPHLRAGPLGHVNSASGLGGWDTGHDLVTAFAAGAGLATG